VETWPDPVLGFWLRSGEGNSQRLERLFLEHCGALAAAKRNPRIRVVHFDRAYNCRWILTPQFRGKPIREVNGCCAKTEPKPYPIDPLGLTI